MSSTAPQAPKPLPVKRDNMPSKQAKRQTWRDKKEQRQKYLVTGFLAFVFGLSTLMMFAMNPFEGLMGSAPTPKAGKSVSPEEEELSAKTSEIEGTKDHPKASLYFDRGELYYKQQKWPEAAADYKKAIELDPQDAMSMSHLGTVLLNEDNVKDALPVLEKAQTTEAAQAAARKAKGEEGDLRDINIPERLFEAYTLLGQKDKAAAALAQAKDVDVRHLLGFLVDQSQQLYIGKDNKALAATYAEEAAKTGVTLAPQVKAEVYGNLAFMDYQMTQFMSIIEKQPSKDPSSKEGKAMADMKAREEKSKAWLEMFMGVLSKDDPASAAEISMTVDQMMHPPPTGSPSAAPGSASPAAKTSAAAAPATSGSAGAPAPVATVVAPASPAASVAH